MKGEKTRKSWLQWTELLRKARHLPLPAAEIKAPWLGWDGWVNISEVKGKAKMRR